MSEKTFSMWIAPKSYRYKEEAILNHAPQTPGIYQIVTFDAEQNAQVLYAGLVLDRTIYDALFEHWNGDRDPKAQELLAQYPNLYFSFVIEADAETPEDWKDLYWAICQTDKPSLQDLSTIQHTGRYTKVDAREKTSLL